MSLLVRRTAVVASLMAIAIVAVGCVVETEPNDTQADADANNLHLIYNSNPDQGPPDLGTAGNGDVDQWVFFNNGASAQLFLTANTRATGCLAFEVEYCDVTSPSWSACADAHRVSVAPIDVVACDQQGPYGTLFTLEAGHFARVLVRGTLTGLNTAVPYSFSLGPR